MPREHLTRILVPPRRHERGETILHVGGQTERVAYLTRRAPAAIRDDVGGHRGAEPSVAAIHVLDDGLAPLAARQIEVDIRPLSARLAQEALEEQFHADGIDGGDAERI